MSKGKVKVTFTTPFRLQDAVALTSSWKCLVNVILTPDMLNPNDPISNTF